MLCKIEIVYTNVFSGTENVSLKYTVYHNKIEEDIIISERGDIASVSMNMDIGSLIPIVNEDGSVNLVNGNYEMQFHIGIPYMVDANNCVCNDIEVTDEQLSQISDFIIEEFDEIDEITDAEIADFMAKYYDTYKEQINSGELPDELPDSLIPDELPDELPDGITIP